MTDYWAARSKCRPVWNCEKMRGQCHYLMPMSSIKYLLRCLWASNNKHARVIHFRQAWELIWNIGGPRHPPPPPGKCPPSKSMQYVATLRSFLWKYINFFFIHTDTDWWPGESPHISRLQTTDHHPKHHLTPVRNSPLISKPKVRDCDVWKQDQELKNHGGTAHWCVPGLISSQTFTSSSTGILPP